MSLPVGAPLSERITERSTERIREGAWSAIIPADPTGPCELTTGGYDHAAQEQDPLLLIVVGRDGSRPGLRVNAIAHTALGRDELLRAQAVLRVSGRAGVPLVPAGIDETERERRVTFRPRFPGRETAGLRALVATLQRAERVELEINGSVLEPAFSLEGFSGLWQRVSARCTRAAAPREAGE
jgi:hypothetical protein